ncbi:SDR family NAD(P)-dependent oxidoreductase [Dyadobacter sp. CY323]|uniref:SDR family NAD(P)-dependent oxidoreductase n=1 Tax=Dyadobacter sp. CY323 TaxID=2907302 RepID=UPI001F37AAB1|nr:SDR family oxidoreductase [Dyadobacter sp. CY323]MCE6991263.1 SDR family oxidoreductase [Dyadobacter sp. CY323]
MNRLAGKKALVTGANRGIGRAVVLQLVQEGCEVGIHFLNNKEEAEDLAALVRSQNGIAHVFQADIADLTQVKTLAEEAWEAMSGIDFLVNNAGVSHKKLFLDTTEQDVDLFMDTNFKGTFFLTQSIARSMVKNEVEGAIYTITSVNGIRPGIGQSTYGASKSALETLMRGVALELAPHQIKVNTIAAGAIETDMTREARENPAAFQEINEGIAMGRFGLADEVAAVLVNLLVSGSYLTGESITVDGGLLLMRGYGKPKPYQDNSDQETGGN